jgi:hypothetical protein
LIWYVNVPACVVGGSKRHLPGKLGLPNNAIVCYYALVSAKQRRTKVLRARNILRGPANRDHVSPTPAPLPFWLRRESLVPKAELRLLEFETGFLIIIILILTIRNPGLIIDSKVMYSR